VPGELVSEALGTAIIILFGCGSVAMTVAALNQSDRGKVPFAASGDWLLITTGWGVGVALAVWVAGGVSGAHLNPAVTLGLWIHGAITGSMAWKYFVGEMIGAMIGAFLVYLSYYLHWRDTEDPGLKLAVFCTGPAVRNYAWNLVTEIIGTFVLVFVILLFGSTPSGLGPLAVALLVVSIGASLGGPTGYAINPARDLGPRIAHALLPIKGKGNSDWGYSWVPVVGPIIGGVLAGLLANAFV
jgi:glycerol uptake facilitator protein